MTDDEKRDLPVWLQERAEGCAEQTKILEQELAAPKAEEVQSYFEEMTREGTQVYRKSRMACRADCGE